MVKDTFIFNGFSVIDERQIERKVRVIDTLVEEYYYPFNIESIKDNSDSTMVLMSRSSDLFIRHNYKGFEIKARQGIETAVLYIGELCSSDTVWLDTITFNVLLLERLTSFFHQDSICVPRLLYTQKYLGD